MLKRLMVAACVLLAAGTIRAQDDANVPSVLDITYNSVVEETLTAGGFWDWWVLQAVEGDIVMVDMAASGGLEPLLGLLNPSGDLVARSEDGPADSIIQLEFTVPTSGTYTIVATRVGNLEGTSTGAYTLHLRRANDSIGVNPDQFQDVTFQCNDEDTQSVYEVTTLATLLIRDDAREGMSHRITIYGLDGLSPVIRVNFDVPNNEERFNYCNSNADETVGDTFTLPAEAERSITADDLATVSQLVLNGADEMGLITITFASRGGEGRWAAVVEGFSIDPGGDSDAIEARIGPLAATTSAMQVFMLRTGGRLDPFLYAPEFEAECDDAGRQGCQLGVPSLEDVSFHLAYGEGTTISGSRSAAGLILAPGDPDPMVVEIRSRDDDTRGDYALVLVGELPPRE